jgi:hypothetical protein
LFSSGPAIEITISAIACEEKQKFNTIQFNSSNKNEAYVCVVLTNIVLHVSTESVVYC